MQGTVGVEQNSSLRSISSITTLGLGKSDGSIAPGRTDANNIMPEPAPQQPMVAWTSDPHRDRDRSGKGTGGGYEGSRPGFHRKRTTESLRASDRLNKFVGGVIIANTFMLGLEIDLEPEGNAPEDHIPWIISESVFILIYLVEVVIRMWVERYCWFVSRWNWLDVFVLLIAIVDTWWLSFMPVDNSVHFLGLFKILRLVRVCRVLRLVRNHKALALALLSLRESLNGLCCVCCIMLTGIFVSAIFMTQFVGKTELGLLELGDYSGVERFGTITRSMYSLFELLTLEGWHLVGRPLVDAEPFMAVFFFGFIMIFTFGLLNLLIGVVVERTLFNSDLESLRKEEVRQREVDRQLQIMQEAFEACDHNQDGQVDRTEFEEAVRGRDGDANVHLLDILQQLGITTTHALELFDMLDTDKSGEISFKEFKRGLSRLLGASDPLVDHCATRALLESMTSDLGNFRGEILRDLEMLVPSRSQHTDAAPRPPALTLPPRPSTPLGCPDAMRSSAMSPCRTATDPCLSATEPIDEDVSGPCDAAEPQLSSWRLRGRSPSKQ